MAETTTKPPALPPIPRRTPVLDAQSGLMNRQWVTWFELSYRRQGQANAPSNDQLDESLTGTQGDLSGTQEDLAGTQASLEQTQADLTAVTTRVTTVEGEVDTLQTDVTALTTRVTTLEGQMTALTTRVTTLEGQMTALTARVTALETAPPKGVRVVRTAVQSIPATTGTVLTWTGLDTGGIDQGPFWSASQPTRLTVPGTQWYTVVAQINWASQPGGTREIALRVNGAATYLEVSRQLGETTDATHLITTIAYLTAGDYVEVVVQHSAPSALDVTGHCSLALTQGRLQAAA